MIESNNNLFSEKLQIWYRINVRDLPWRKTKDPYFIWLSEVILQQTRVAQGMPYYLRFVEEYPTILHLAQAPIDHVLRLWQGLGYYSRARNMHETAQIIQNNHQGIFPDNYSDLLQLKGIGTYTAAAIASFAFNEHVAVLDGNVFRVLARVYGEETDIASPKGKKVFSDLAFNLLPKINSDIHNQAMMEFGALHCTPKNPLCNTCPLNSFCVAFNKNTQNDLPVKLKKLTVKKRYFHYFIIENNGKYFLRKRDEKGIWQGLFDFLLIETAFPSDIDAVFTDKSIKPILQNALIKSVSDEYIHLLTHQKLHIRFIHIKLTNDAFQTENFQHFYDEEELEALPKPIVVANYIKQMEKL